MKPDFLFSHTREETVAGVRIADRKQVAPVITAAEASVSNHQVSRYGFWRTRELEAQFAIPPEGGVWPINCWRCDKYHGDPGIAKFPDVPGGGQPNFAGVQEHARSFRLHHYFRVRSSAQAIRFLQRNNRKRFTTGREIRYSLVIGDEWANPAFGEISQGHVTRQGMVAHAVPLSQYLPTSDEFVFQNSWGSTWGAGGFGFLKRDVFDESIIEAWVRMGLAHATPITLVDQRVVVSWQGIRADGEPLHGVEILEPGTNRPLAWTFATICSSRIEVEEFFVWPTERGKGFAHVLARKLSELSVRLNKPLHAWVSHADAETAKDGGLDAVLRILRLSARPAIHPWAAYSAVTSSKPVHRVDFALPARPASMREELGTRKFRVYFGTNRLELKEGVFSGERGPELRVGYCDVSIPKSHKFGSVGSKWWKRWLAMTDDRLRIVNRHALTLSDFSGALQGILDECNPGEKYAMVYVHGFNVDFEEAAIRSAQIGFDLRIEGVTAFYSWPSQGDPSKYFPDEAAIEASEDSIAEFLSVVANLQGIEKVHILAHSMGNRGVLRALNRLVSKAERAGVPIGQIFFAAADVDAQTFRNLATSLRGHSDQATLYCSSRDCAVWLSRFVHDYPRAGLYPPVTVVDGLDTVLVQDAAKIFDLGHGYYAEAASLLSDMFDCIRNNSPPSQRQRIHAQSMNGAACWALK